MIQGVSGIQAPQVAATFGCFACALAASERIRLHFNNQDTEEHSFLGVPYIQQRYGDLIALF